MTESIDVHNQLIDLRRQHGAESPIGWRCTNLLEGLERYSKETDLVARQNIAAGIARQNGDLARLLRQ